MKSKTQLIKHIFIGILFVLAFVFYRSGEINGLAFGIIFILIILNIDLS